MMNAADMIAEAEKRAGIADPEPQYHVNVEKLVDSLNRDGRFSARGEAAARQGLVDRQTDRLEGLKWVTKHPEITEVPIVDPVFLTGLPRSGTTYFQYLFDHDRRFRLIRTWESIMPNPPPGADPASVARRKAIEEEGITRLTPEVEGFDALHLIDKDGPQECGTYLDQTGATAGYFNLYDCPDYFDWLMGGLDLEASYRVHKRQLQLLQWQLPQPRWALKFPNHVIAMDAIVAVYPDARFVMTHRDPAQVLASIAKMTFSLRGVGEAAPVDPHRVGRQMMDFIKRHIDRIMAFCTGPHADRVTHVDYYRVAADPAKVLDEVHAGIGVDTPDDVREAIASWRRNNPQGKRGENKYTLEQFGLDEGEVRKLYADYTRYFDIPSEAEGKARARAAA